MNRRGGEGAARKIDLLLQTHLNFGNLNIIHGTHYSLSEIKRVFEHSRGARRERNRSPKTYTFTLGDSLSFWLWICVSVGFWAYFRISVDECSRDYHTLKALIMQEVVFRLLILGDRPMRQTTSSLLFTVARTAPPYARSHCTAVMCWVFLYLGLVRARQSTGRAQINTKQEQQQQLHTAGESR